MFLALKCKSWLASLALDCTSGELALSAILKLKTFLFALLVLTIQDAAICLLKENL